ncbi:hypothetical protein BTUL_0040g00580 [Botrytis tulipae]|uniref:Uncharacterized protein n=1 Tax=Botrytis tulipae TaxID=87230 RepID=A0A4Z1EVF7_9HELO|nr:hypothetical protein BTUL_0040g00580 [Botrytis tulipae]
MPYNQSSMYFLKTSNWWDIEIAPAYSPKKKIDALHIKHRLCGNDAAASQGNKELQYNDGYLPVMLSANIQIPVYAPCASQPYVIYSLLQKLSHVQKACSHLLTDPIREANFTGAGNDLLNVSRSEPKD